MKPHPIPCAILGTALLLVACSDPTAEARRENSGGEKELPLVRVEPIEEQTVRREIEATSTLESEHRVRVLSKVSGRVQDVSAKEGARVAKGDLLAVLDDREAQLSLRQAESKLEEQKVKLELTRLQVDLLQRKQEQARIEVEETKAEFDRNSGLDSESVSSKKLQESKFAYDKALEAQLVAKLDERKSKLDVKVAEQQIRELESKRDEAKLRLEDHTIRSPMDGVVVKQMIKGGETISVSTELFDVLDNNNLIAYLKRPQSELSLMRKAKAIIFTTDAWSDRQFTADVDLVSRTIDSTTGSFELRVRVRKDDAAVLLPGMFLRARILTEEERKAVMVPKTAILADGETSLIFVVRDGKAVRINLDPGLETSTHVECRNRGNSGLRDDDMIITGGQTDLRDQDRVETSTPPAGKKQ